MAWAEKWRIKFDRLPYKFNLECLADFQLGSRSCCEWKINQHIDDILENAKHTDSGVLFAGDIEDEDRPSTRMIRAKIAAERGEVIQRDAEKHKTWLDVKVIPMLLRLHKGTKYGIMGGVAGHHFTNLPAHTDDDGKVVDACNSVQYIYRRLAELSGKPCIYLGEMVSFVEFCFESQQFGHTVRQVGLLQHGEGGGATKSSTITKLDRAAQGFDADFFIRGHDCQIVGFKTDQLYPKLSRGGEPAILCRTRASLNLGSATLGYELNKTAPSYIESAMMRPASMGWGTIKFRLRKAFAAEDKNQSMRCDLKVEF